jgi:hypothetical protein
MNKADRDVGANETERQYADALAEDMSMDERIRRLEIIVKRQSRIIGELLDRTNHLAAQ